MKYVSFVHAGYRINGFQNHHLQCEMSFVWKNIWSVVTNCKFMLYITILHIWKYLKFISIFLPYSMRIFLMDGNIPNVVKYWTSSAWVTCYQNLLWVFHDKFEKPTIHTIISGLYMYNLISNTEFWILCMWNKRKQNLFYISMYKMGVLRLLYFL